MIESGGDNLTATLSPELADASIHFIDVAEGGPSREDQASSGSGLLVINKIDLASYVGTDLAVMERDGRVPVENGPLCSPTCGGRPAPSRLSTGLSGNFCSPPDRVGRDGSLWLMTLYVSSSGDVYDRRSQGRLGR